MKTNTAAYQLIRYKLGLAQRRFVPPFHRNMQLTALLKGSRNARIMCREEPPETWEDFFDQPDLAKTSRQSGRLKGKIKILDDSPEPWNDWFCQGPAEDFPEREQ